MTKFLKVFNQSNNDIKNITKDYNEKNSTPRLIDFIISINNKYKVLNNNKIITAYHGKLKLNLDNIIDNVINNV